MRGTLSPTVVAVLALLALAPACGGALSANLDGKGDSGGGGSGGGSGSGGGGGGSGSSSGASIDSGSGGSDAGQAPVDAIAALDVTGPADVTAVEEQGPPPSGASVLCPSNGSANTCDPGQFCCVVGDAQQGGTQTDTCEPAGTSCAGTPVECASPADCPGGQVCCGTEQTVGNVVSYAGVVCAVSCAGTDQRLFCDPASNACPSAKPTCALSTLMPGFSVCNQ